MHVLCLDQTAGVDENKHTINRNNPRPDVPIQHLAPADPERISKLSWVNIAMGAFYVVVFSVIFTICACACWKNFVVSKPKSVQYSVLSQSDLDAYELPRYARGNAGTKKFNAKAQQEREDAENNQL